ncbi:MAG: hypothetical protein ALECFALPRED_009529 [Alectoria fallacina]|uniref:Uncharacterized protein n=1 Tax=Alectoria fallacina TaxID=1903189 RepID=A0A8H3F237_9LECA|nr:MAG: hypothetical protein ALECFALPRED_009529 [Alectoria fallacina]
MKPKRDNRRDQWNHGYGFGGVNASPAEKEAEARRRASYDARIEAFRRRPPRAGRSASPTSSPTSASHNNPPVHPIATSTVPRRTTPSIPTAPNNHCRPTCNPQYPNSAQQHSSPPHPPPRAQNLEGLHLQLLASQHRRTKRRPCLPHHHKRKEDRTCDSQINSGRPFGQRSRRSRPLSIKYAED